MDNLLLAQIQQVLARLNAPISVLDTEGNCLIPGEGIRYTLPPLPQPGEAVIAEGRMYQQCANAPQLVLATPVEDARAARDMFLLCDAMITATMNANTAGNDIGSAYQRLLQNELSLAELDAVVEEHRITPGLLRCVVLMHFVQVKQRNAAQMLTELLPSAPGDVLVSMDKHTVALIKHLSGNDEYEDMAQYAAALQETVLSETGLNMTIGIGDIAHAAGELHASYRQARRAIEIGRIYSPEKTIHVYRLMLLERFLSDLSPEMAEHYHDLLFNRSTSRLFSEEMLYTIEMFFRKDLNLSDTARQLYIHRNTLVYRLDKVQRQVGLDLRKFEDAVTFKMLLEMKKCGNNKVKPKKTH